MTHQLAGALPLGENSSEYSEPLPKDKDVSILRGLLITAASKLESAEALLLDPTPGHVQQAEQFLGEAAGQIRVLELEFSHASGEAGALHEEAFALQSILRRLLALLHGALRIQWHRMRRTGLYIETYTSGGRTKVCVHRSPRLDVEV